MAAEDDSAITDPACELCGAIDKELRLVNVKSFLLAGWAHRELCVDCLKRIREAEHP